MSEFCNVRHQKYFFCQITLSVYSHTYNDALCAKRNFKKVTTVDLQQQCRGTYVCLSFILLVLWWINKASWSETPCDQERFIEICKCIYVNMIEYRFAICSASCLHFNASLLHRLLCKTLYTKVAEKCRPIIFHPYKQNHKGKSKNRRDHSNFLLSTSSVTWWAFYLIVSHSYQ